MNVNEKTHEKVQILTVLYCQSKTIFTSHYICLFKLKKA